MIRSWPSLVIGLVLPAVVLIGGITGLSGSGARVAGTPVLFLWVFCCFPFFSLCLWVSWRFFDRDAYREEAEGR